MWTIFDKAWPKTVLLTIFWMKNGRIRWRIKKSHFWLAQTSIITTRNYFRWVFARKIKLASRRWVVIGVDVGLDGIWERTGTSRVCKNLWNNEQRDGWNWNMGKTRGAVMLFDYIRQPWWCRSAHSVGRKTPTVMTICCTPVTMI